MHVLVLNCGSSSVKAAVLNPETGDQAFRLQVDKMLSDEPTIEHTQGGKIKLAKAPYEDLLEQGLNELKKCSAEMEISGVGHRIAHGGDYFQGPMLLDEEAIKKVEEFVEQAPLHNPMNLAGIRIARKIFPNVQHIGVCDTAFHSTIPKRAITYALPKQLTERHHLRKYGFHGMSHGYVAKKAAEFMGEKMRNLRIITCHLGNGASVCAVEYGRSVETSMGMTPLEGLVMGTRPGDIDPGMLLYVMDKEGLTAKQMADLLNKESGLYGLTGLSNDLRDISERAAEGHEASRNAIQIYAHRVRKYIGAYAAVMGGVDAIVFTGGIGENSSMMRHRIAQRLDYMGAIFHEDKNRECKVSIEQPVEEVSFTHSRCKLLIIQTNEELEIARQAAELISDRDKVNNEPLVPISVSARHVHLTQETVEELFGEGYKLTEFKQLYQPGNFAANETVDLIGPKNTIKKVRILGPTRKANQVEISRTDEFVLGIDAPVRESGKTQNSPGIILQAPNGNRVELSEGVICAWRHIHMSPEDAERFGVEDKDVVSVEVDDPLKGITFGNVLIRVNPQFKLEMHIDTDEANAAEIGAETNDSQGRLIKKRVL